MTGLDSRKDQILEIAVRLLYIMYCNDAIHFEPTLIYRQVLITNGKLELVDKGIQFVIHTEKSVLDR